MIRNDSRPVFTKYKQLLVSLYTEKSPYLNVVELESPAIHV